MITVAMARDLKVKFTFVYASLWNQCAEAGYSLIDSLLSLCASIQRRPVPVAARFKP
jgi:hypothetical protein